MVLFFYEFILVFGIKNENLFIIIDSEKVTDRELLDKSPRSCSSSHALQSQRLQHPSGKATSA